MVLIYKFYEEVESLDEENLSVKDLPLAVGKKFFNHSIKNREEKFKSLSSEVLSW